MADDIAINRAQRTTLFSLQQIDRDSAVAQRRLSFGRRIIDVTDGAVEFFQARALSNRISDTKDRNAQVRQAIQGLSTFVTGTQSLQRQLDSARAQVLQAEINLAGSAESRESITRDFVSVLKNFYESARSLDYNGLNLLVNQNRQFSVRFSDRQSDQLVINGRNLFTFGEYSIDKGNLFGRNVVDGTGQVTFANAVVADATAADSIVIRGGNAASVIETLFNADGTLKSATPAITFSGATLSVGGAGTTKVTLNDAGTTTDITTAVTYGNVDQVVFDGTIGINGTKVVDNGDGSFTITGITADSLELGETLTSGVEASIRPSSFDGFSAFNTSNGGSVVLDEIRATLDLAKDRLETIESYLGSNIALLQERERFGINYANDLTVGRDFIVLADVNEEAAILTTLRTRNQIGIGALASNAESEQQLLRLLS